MFFKTPFAFGGTKTAIPLTNPGDGSVNYNDGFGVFYQDDPAGDGLNIPRAQFNELQYEITNLLNKYQIQAFPDFITSADNGGTPYSYSINAYVRYGGIIYYSLVYSNTDTPPSAKWSAVSYSTATQPTGISNQYWGLTLPSGYVWANGQTIGDASSGATGRANSDTSALFALLWGSMTDAVLPIYTNAGALSSRGSSAASDFAAHKRLSVPDLRGRVAAGMDNMGGASAAGLITVLGCNISGATLGASGGAQNVGLVGANNGAHTHSASTGDSTVVTQTQAGDDESGTGAFWEVGPAAVPRTLPSDASGSHSHSVTVSSSGSGTAHLNVQPTIICNYIIKL